MKTPQTVVTDIQRRLRGNWHRDLAGTEPAFPHAFPLGRPASVELKSDYSAVHVRTLEWQGWAKMYDVELVYENRVAKGGSTQVLPTHAMVTSIDHAASIVASDWPERLKRGRERLATMRERFPHVIDVDPVLRLVDGYSGVDFQLLLAVSDWYLEDPARAALGVTPRQVPVPGVHAKWLQSHKVGVQALTRLDDLGILQRHPARIHFTYLDPGHRAAGARIHDSATVGDAFTPAYAPELVVISENKDTAIHFPPVPGGVSVEGNGRGGRTAAAFPWIRDAPVVVYWGDIDRDGFEILDGYRADFGRDIDSIFMDKAAYERYEPFGTDLDQHGKPLTTGGSRSADRLRADERSVYLRVLDDGHAGHRRIEQERIPLDRALDAVIRICGRSFDSGRR